jgi:hypothetical protein
MSTVPFFPTVTSVRRPITAEGLTTNTLPLPLLVLIPAERLPAHAPFRTTPHIPVVPPLTGKMQVWPGVVQLALLVHEEPLVLSTH